MHGRHPLLSINSNYPLQRKQIRDLLCCPGYRQTNALQVVDASSWHHSLNRNRQLLAAFESPLKGLRPDKIESPRTLQGKVKEHAGIN